MIYYILMLMLIIMAIFINYNKKLGKNSKKIFLFISFLAITLIASFRNYTVGIDTKQYYHAFQKIVYLEPEEFSTLRYELGFIYLCKVVSSIGLSYQFLIALTSIFINFTIFRFIWKYSKNVYLSTILYIACNFFFAYMNIMRQALAICILLWGFEFLKEKKYVKYIIITFIAAQFHSSAYLTLLLIFVDKIKYNKKTIFWILFATILSFAFGRTIFIKLAYMSPRLYEYVGGKFDVENYFGAFVEFCIYLISCIFGVFCLRNKDISKDEISDDDKLMTKIVGLAVILSAMVMRVSIFNRFLPYFSVYIIIWIPNVIMKIKNKSRSIYIYMIVLFYVLYWAAIMMYRPEWYGVLPYKTFFS